MVPVLCYYNLLVDFIGDFAVGVKLLGCMLYVACSGCAMHGCLIGRAGHVVRLLSRGIIAGASLRWLVRALNDLLLTTVVGVSCSTRLRECVVRNFLSNKSMNKTLIK